MTLSQNQETKELNSNKTLKKRSLVKTDSSSTWIWARQPLHPHSTTRAKGLRLCSHSHFGQQLPLPELIPLLFSQLLSLACLDQLQSPLDLILYTVHLPQDRGNEGWRLPHPPFRPPPTCLAICTQDSPLGTPGAHQLHSCPLGSTCWTWPC